MPQNTQKLSVDEKMAILIKAYELEPLPKLSLLIGERAVKELLHSGQYLGALLQPKNLYWITGEDIDVKLMDEDTARVIRDHPVTGYSHYISDHGAANVFGRQVFEGKMPLEPAIGAASAIGIVEQDQEGRTHVLKKQQMGIEPKSIRQVADKFHRVEPETPDLLKRKRPKEMYEEIHDRALEAKEERERRGDQQDSDQDVLEPHFLYEDEMELKEEKQQTPPLKEEKEVQLVHDTEPQTVPQQLMLEKDDDEDDEEYYLPF